MILITGGAGFIGFHMTNFLVEKGFKVHIVDNLNNFNYPSQIKIDRLNFLKKKFQLGKDFYFSKINILNNIDLKKCFEKVKQVIHLAAYPGIRKSSLYSNDYISNNILGMSNVLNNCREFNIKKIIYASSSSVYDSKTELSEENEIINNPKNIYSFTKLSNELLAKTYSYLFDLNCFGLRFFSVYGNFGRPDMSYYKFTDAIINEKIINLSRNGEQKRDFTHISDVINSMYKIIKSNNDSKNKIINIGSGKPIKINSLIRKIEKITGKKAKIEFDKIYKEEALNTGSDINFGKNFYNFKFQKNIDSGLKEFIFWFQNLNKLN